MKRFKHRIEYAVLKTVEFALCALPLSWALAAGEQVGALMSLVLKKRRVLIIDNLTRAFPEKTPAEIQLIARQNWRNLGRTALEFMRSSDYMSPEALARVTWVGMDRIESTRTRGCGGILITSHFTNWEILGMMFQERVKNVMAIARPIKNPYVEKWIQDKRTQHGMKITLHRDAVKASLRWLNAHNILGILTDQNLYHGGVFVNFFNRPAATTTLPALLHMRTGAEVYVSYLLRENGTFRAVFDSVEFPPNVPEDQRALVYTQTISDALERVIRRYPENWFWIHNRWKRQPEPELTTVS